MIGLVEAVGKTLKVKKEAHAFIIDHRSLLVVH
jgi:hypothetical protein